MERSMSEIKLFNRWTVKKSTFWISLTALIVVFLVLVFLASIFLSARGYGLTGVR